MRKQIGSFLLIAAALVFLILQFPGGTIHQLFDRRGKVHVQESSSQKPIWNVCFSPEGGCTKNIVDALNQAKSTILVQAYSFTSEPLAEALVNAHKRGVKVEVILDRSQVRVKRGQVHALIDAGISVNIDAAHAIAHNKVMVIDGMTVITGSFNFTVDAALYNAENLLIIQDKNLADQYTSNWQRHKEHSKSYETWIVSDAVRK